MHEVISTVGCACDAQHVGAVMGADAGLQWSKVNGAINVLDATLNRTRSVTPEWSAFVSDWRSRTDWSGPALVEYSERLARLAEALGGAKANRSIVGAFDLGALFGGGGSGGRRGLVDTSSGDARTARDIDDAVSGVIDTIAPVLPYGSAIQAVSRARREIMYGSDAASSPSSPSSSFAGKTSRMQTLVRQARKGDAAASAQLATVRTSAASGNVDAQKDLRVAVAVRRDDNQRIARLYDISRQQAQRAPGASKLSPSSASKGASSTASRAAK